MSNFERRISNFEGRILSLAYSITYLCGFIVGVCTPASKQHKKARIAGPLQHIKKYLIKLECNGNTKTGINLFSVLLAGYPRRHCSNNSY